MKKALLLSGGGYRATLFHLGAIRALYEQGELKNISHIISVSGGSILAAHMALHWSKYSGKDLEFEQAANDVINFARNSSLRDMLILSRIFNFLFPSIFVSNVAEILYEKGLFGNSTLKDIASECARPKFYFLVDMTSRYKQTELCAFTAFGIERLTKNIKIPAADMPLSKAVTASSAYPLLIPKIYFTREELSYPKEEDLPHNAKFRDGGIVTNSGVLALSNIINSGTVFDTVFLSDASQNNEACDNEDSENPITELNETFNAIYAQSLKKDSEILKNLNECKKISNLFIFDISHFEPNTKIPIEIQRVLPHVRTDLNCFNNFEILALIKHGYLVAKSKLGSLDLDPKESTWTILNKEISLRDKKNLIPKNPRIFKFFAFISTFLAILEFYLNSISWDFICNWDLIILIIATIFITSAVVLFIFYNFKFFHILKKLENGKLGHGRKSSGLPTSDSRYKETIANPINLMKSAASPKPEKFYIAPNCIELGLLLKKLRYHRKIDKLEASQELDLIHILENYEDGFIYLLRSDKFCELLRYYGIAEELILIEEGKKEKPTKFIEIIKNHETVESWLFDLIGYGIKKIVFELKEI